MARYQVILAYDGTAFSGMQRQAEARTVQAVVEDALRQIGWQERSILAAGRTDAGVHASGQVVAFDLDWKHTENDLLNALNATLPEDAAAKAVIETREDFHPRYDARVRSYRYQVFCQPQRDPLRERFAWRVWPMPDQEKMNTAANLLVGEHDFAAFGSPPKTGGPTIRQVFAAEWQQEAEAYYFNVSANAFLYHMVRRMVHLTVEIGLGRQEVTALSEALQGSPDEIIQGLAPPHGLFLTEVRYD